MIPSFSFCVTGGLLMERWSRHSHAADLLVEAAITRGEKKKETAEKSFSILWVMLLYFPPNRIPI